MIVSCRQMQQIEQAAFDQGVPASELMETAGCGIADAIRQFCPKPGTAVLYLGTGHNAGDALVAARELQHHGWSLMARLAAGCAGFKPLPRHHYDAFGGDLAVHPTALAPDNLPPGPVILIDGLLGIGAQGPLRSEIRSLTRELNTLRRLRHAITFALDLPTGLDADSGVPETDAVEADFTLTVALTKKGLIADTAPSHVGRLVVIRVADLTPPEDASGQVLTAPALRTTLRPRPFDTHKGQAGRVGIIAGSPGYYGAAELVCRGALALGAGLVTLYTLPAAYQILATRLPPEVMVKRIKHYSQALEDRHDALAIGPGLGSDAATGDAVLGLTQSCAQPVVLDAEALNILSRNSNLSSFLADLRHPRLLTPHPGEWQRLRQALNLRESNRLGEAQAFAAAFPALTLLLKGSRTLISSAGKPPRWNTTGHPGMATGGMGDVLTGAITALLGQGIPPVDAASLGAWLCGRAAEIDAIARSSWGTLPSGILTALPNALRDLSEGVY